jgi:lipid A 4'-phosphatase
MKTKVKTVTLIGLCAALLVALLLWVGLDRQADIAISNLFYRSEGGFFLANGGVFLTIHWLATIGARILGIGLLVATLVAFIRRKPLLAVSPIGWLFLLVSLLIVPGLVVNLGFKDHWGRARPHETTEFGGAIQGEPALMPQTLRHKNGSFVAGDPAFGFFLTTFAYVVPRTRSRRVFWGGMAAGLLCSLTRIAMGAHFFSDAFYAAVIVLGLVAILHGLFFNYRLTFDCWRLWFGRTKLNA